MAHLVYRINIRWQTVWDELQRMSSYEGILAVTPSGESNYIYVHITDQDEALILQHIMQGIHDLESNLSNLLTDVMSTGYTKSATTTYTFTLDSARTSYRELEKMLTEAIASYVMIQWVSERKSERREFYTNLYQQMITGIQKVVTKKIKPSLDITY